MMLGTWWKFSEANSSRGCLGRNVPSITPGINRKTYGALRVSAEDQSHKYFDTHWILTLFHHFMSQLRMLWSLQKKLNIKISLFVISTHSPKTTVNYGDKLSGSSSKGWLSHVLVTRSSKPHNSPNLVDSQNLWFSLLSEAVHHGLWVLGLTSW